MHKIWNFASYNLLLLHSPQVGMEHLHCDMKRGFTKARKRETQVARLLEQDNYHQRIGLLAQRGVYEFHHQNSILSRTDDIAGNLDQLLEILQLQKETEKVQERVITILKKYCDNPMLLGKNIVSLSRGDEGFPKPILIKNGNYLFNLYAAIDCIFKEDEGTIHILDFKTGKSDFDKRQAYIYLLAATYLYPQQKVVASFYNLETQTWSKPLSATPEILQTYEIRLVKLSQKHQQQMKVFRSHPEEFDRIFPANPSIACRYCPFNSICQYVVTDVISEIAA